MQAIDKNAVWERIYLSMKRPPARKVWERFIAKIDMRMPWECWPWMAGKFSRMGHGCFRLPEMKNSTTTQWTWGIWLYDIQKPLVMDHLVCSAPTCANPTHLMPSTQRENTLRRGSKNLGRANMLKTHCNFGHVLDRINLRTSSFENGKRQCVQCAGRQQKAARIRSAALSNGSILSTILLVLWLNPRNACRCAALIIFENASKLKLIYKPRDNTPYAQLRKIVRSEEGVNLTRGLNFCQQYDGDEQ